MFGFLYSLFVGGAHCVKGIRDSVENEEYRQKYHDDVLGTYKDRDMKTRDQKTGRILVTQQDPKTKDMILVDALSCKPVRNITMTYAEQHYQEERQKFLAGKTNKTYVKYGNNDHHNDKIRGYRYKDLATGKLYVMRELCDLKWDNRRKNFLHENTIICLMDMNTGEFVRPSDSEVFWTIYHGKLTDSLYKRIEKENEEKKKMLQRQREDLILQSKYDDWFYSNYNDYNGFELDDEQSIYPLKEKEIQNKKKLGLL